MKLTKKLFFIALLLSIGVCTDMVHAMRQLVSLQGEQKENELVQGRSCGGNIIVFGMRVDGIDDDGHAHEADVPAGVEGQDRAMLNGTNSARTDEACVLGGQASSTRIDGANVL